MRRKARGGKRVLAASPRAGTLTDLMALGLETIFLPVLAAGSYRQIRHMLSVVWQMGKVSPDDLIVCAMGAAVLPTRGCVPVLYRDGARTAASVVISATDGNVCVFSGG